MLLIDRLAKEEHKTILYSSHDLELLMKHATTMWVVAKGKPLISGTPKELDQKIESYLNIHKQ
jgi:energy-coupling factor transporter ATP-binding protein EcfA2